MVLNITENKQSIKFIFLSWWVKQPKTQEKTETTVTMISKKQFKRRNKENNDIKEAESSSSSNMKWTDERTDRISPAGGGKTYIIPFYFIFLNSAPQCCTALNIHIPYEGRCIENILCWQLNGPHRSRITSGVVELVYSHRADVGFFSRNARASSHTQKKEFSAHWKL